MSNTPPLKAALVESIAAFCRGDPGRSVALFTEHEGVGLIAANGDVARPAASVIKVPLLMAVYDAAESGALSLDQRVRVSELTSTRYVSIMTAFSPDTALTLKELAALALMTSDNPLAVYFASRIGFERVNEVMARCGCSRAARMAASFREEELGPANRVNQLSAHDGVRIFQALASRPLYTPLVGALVNNLRNNRIPALLPDDAVVAHKTGSLQGVANDVGSVTWQGRQFILAVLTDNQADTIATSAAIAVLADRILRTVAAQT
jgi:beta-lactamase class A